MAQTNSPALVRQLLDLLATYYKSEALPNARALAETGHGARHPYRVQTRRVQAALIDNGRLTRRRWC